MAVDEATLALVRQHMRAVQTPTFRDKVFKEECMFSYDTPESPGGLYVSLVTFQVRACCAAGALLHTSVPRVQNSRPTACALALSSAGLWGGVCAPRLPAQRQRTVPAREVDTGRSTQFVQTHREAPRQSTPPRTDACPCASHPSVSLAVRRDPLQQRSRPQQTQPWQRSLQPVTRAGCDSTLAVPPRHPWTRPTHWW